MDHESACIARGAANTMHEAARSMSGTASELEHNVVRQFRELVEQQHRIAIVMVKVAGMQAENSQSPDSQPHSQTAFLLLLNEL